MCCIVFCSVILDGTKFVGNICANNDVILFLFIWTNKFSISKRSHIDVAEFMLTNLFRLWNFLFHSLSPFCCNEIHSNDRSMHARLLSRSMLLILNGALKFILMKLNYIRILMNWTIERAKQNHRLCCRRFLFTLFLVRTCIHEYKVSMQQ